MADRLTHAVAAAIDAAPCSVRALARQAGVSYTLLQRIQAGDGRATERVAAQVAVALHSWAGTCTKAARAIERARMPARRVRR